MKKLLILSVVILGFAAQAQHHPTVPSYDELKTTGYEAYQNQDYKTDWIPTLSDRYMRQQVPDSVYLERLQVMSDADQNARRMLDSEVGNDSVWRVIHEVDAANLIGLKQLIAERGFPTLS